MLKPTLKKLNLSIFYYSLSNKNLEVVKMFCVILINRLTIIFMLIFVAFLSLSLNYTKAFKIKNEIITTIEKYEGLTSSESKTSPGSIKIINNYLYIIIMVHGRM